MQRTTRIPAILAFLLLFGAGGGCVAIYSFDDFEKDPPTPCKTDEQCPKENECGKYVCEGEVCKIPNPVAIGQLTTSNRLGDCFRFTCDGKGNRIIQLDNEDVPDDRFACTIDACANGAPMYQQAPVGTPCGIEPHVTCNAAGACAGCVADSDCGEDNPCTKWACENSLCVKNILLVGTIVTNSVIGDCRAIVCNGFGDVEEAIAPGDFPPDGNECTADACTLDGKAVHPPSNIDTPCGTCGTCSKDGSCVACDEKKYDCYNGTCISKPKTCTSTNECPSTYCVDGFCCDTECSSTCMACSNDKTGVPSGVCAPIADGTDPEEECGDPATNTCSQGVCRCENGLRDGDESGVDCGGSCNACTGTWSCGGVTACDGVGAATPCCSLGGCIDCVNQSAQCKELEGKTCALGAAPKKLSFGTVGQASCIPLFTGCKTVTCNCVP